MSPPKVPKASVKHKKKIAMPSPHLFNAIAVHFPSGIIGVLDQDLRYVFVGGTELHKLGLDHMDLIGDQIFDQIHPESNAYAEPFLRKAFTSEKVSFELAISGNCYSVIAVPISENTGPATQILVVINNITDQKKIEDGLKKVIEKQKELNDMKTRFVSIASHEFRTPLSTILSSSGLAEKYDKPEDAPKRAKHLARIKSSVHNLTEILNDFLTLGKIEEGGVKNNPVGVSLRTFFKDLLEEMGTNVKKGQQIKLSLHGNDDGAYLDAKHFKNVLLNLLSNAIKYSPEGKAIYLTASCDGKTLEVKVRDEGIGIPAEDQHHLFTTFYRANNVTAIQGTGMGLHIVKKYLELMGGSISFVSVLGQGTTFTVSLPDVTVPDGQISNIGSAS